MPPSGQRRMSGLEPSATEWHHSKRRVETGGQVNRAVVEPETPGPPSSEVDLTHDPQGRLLDLTAQGAVDGELDRRFLTARRAADLERAVGSRHRAGHLVVLLLGGLLGRDEQHERRLLRNEAGRKGLPLDWLTLDRLPLWRQLIDLGPTVAVLDRHR